MYIKFEKALVIIANNNNRQHLHLPGDLDFLKY